MTFCAYFPQAAAAAAAASNTALWKTACASEVNLTYIFRPHESLFPAYFCELLIARLASEFCLPLTESTTRSEYLQKTFQELEKRARLTDAQQSTPQRFEDFSLVEARQ